MRRRILAATAAATLGLLALGAAPASADPRALPSGDALYAISCSYYSAETAQQPSLQLMQIDTLTAEATLIGTGTPSVESDCAGQGAWNPVTSKAYALAWNFAADPEPFGLLVEVDLATGVSTVIGHITDGGEPIDPWAIAISPTGVAYALDETSLWSFDLSTGAATEIGPSYSSYGLAFDPTSGVLYALDNEGSLYSINLTDGAYTFVGEVPFSGIYSFAIDSSGILWFGVDEWNLETDGYEMLLHSVDRADLANPELSGTLHVGDTAPFSQSLVLTYPVKLAATGSAMDATTLVAGGVLLLGGLVLVGARRAKRA